MEEQKLEVGHCGCQENLDYITVTTANPASRCLKTINVSASFSVVLQGGHRVQEICLFTKAPPAEQEARVFHGIVSRRSQKTPSIFFYEYVCTSVFIPALFTTARKRNSLAVHQQRTRYGKCGPCAQWNFTQMQRKSLQENGCI